MGGVLSLLRASPRAWSIVALTGLGGLALAFPREGSAQVCNRSCEASKRDAQGCCPAAPVPGPQGPGAGPSGGKKCAQSSECPGDQVCIQYKCQKPPSTPPPPPAGRYFWIGIAWNNEGQWTARSGTSLAEANAAALAACNDVTSNCYSSTNPVSGDRASCVAMFRNGKALRTRADASLQAAINGALADCNAANGDGPACYQQIAVCNDHPVAAPSTWSWVGIGWNNKGGWTTRTAVTQQEAQAIALDACNKSFGNCYNAQNPVPGERLQCFAIYYDNVNLFENHDTTLASAAAAALKSCQNGQNGSACKSQIQACNNRR